MTDHSNDISAARWWAYFAFLAAMVAAIWSYAAMDTANDIQDDLKEHSEQAEQSGR